MKIEFEWESATVVPADYQEPVLCLTENGKMMVLKDTASMVIDHTQESGFRKVSDWSWIVNKYRVKFWAYQSELLPAPID